VDPFGGVQERLQKPDGIQDLERPRLDRRGAGLAMRLRLPLNKPHLHAVADELRGGEQTGRSGADDQYVVAGHLISREARLWDWLC
jgi:hypothetical protein